MDGIHKLFSTSAGAGTFTLIFILLSLGGFRWIKKYQYSYRGFLYKFLLTFQIFIGPVFALLQLLSIFENPINIRTFFSIISACLIFHGAYSGYRFLIVTDNSKRRMKLNILLRTGSYIAFMLYDIADGKIHFDYPLSFLIFLILAFWFAFYQFVISLKNDDLDAESAFSPLTTNG